MTVKKNILLLITNLDFGGAQTSFSKLSVELGKHYNVINVVFNRTNAAEYPFSGPLLDLNVKGSSFFLSKALNFVKRIIRLKKIKQEHQIDISISFLEGADYVNIFSGRGEKIILSVRGSKKFDQNIKGIIGYIRHNWLLPYLYRHADRIVAVNSGIQEELITEYKIDTPIKIVSNFYDSEKLQVLANEKPEPAFLNLVNKFKIICIVGRLAPEKGIDLFLPVFRSVKKNVGDCKLLLVGEGILRESLEKQIQELGMKSANSFDGQSDVIFSGYRSNPYQYFSHCTLLALPSLHEGFPNVLVEAMNLGVPVVSSDCPYGPREIFGDDNALAKVLLPVLGSPSIEKTWVEEITRLLQSEPDRAKIAEAGKLKAKSFSYDQTFNQWLDVIEN